MPRRKRVMAVVKELSHTANGSPTVQAKLECGHVVVISMKKDHMPVTHTCWKCKRLEREARGKE